MSRVLHYRAFIVKALPPSIGMVEVFGFSMLFEIIHYRDYMALKKIELTSKRGSISVDKTLLVSDVSIKCFSGADDTGIYNIIRSFSIIALCLMYILACGSCCQANGRCVSGKCQCQSGFTGVECGMFHV